MLEPISPHDFDWFIRLAECENMTRAADSLFMTQSTISRKLARLEKDLGVELFNRIGKNLQINNYGTIIFEHFSRAQAEITQAFARVREAAQPPTGQIALGFLRSLGPKLMPQIIEQFLIAHPNIQFQFQHSDTHYLCDHVVSGSLDLAIFPYKADILRKEYPSLRWKKLFSQLLYLVVHENHPFAARSSISLSECSDEQFILPFKDGGVRTITDNLCATAGFSPQIMHEVSDIFTILGFISSGRGVAILPIDSVDAIPQNIRSIPIDNKDASRDIIIIWSSQHPLLPAAKIFRDFCVQGGFKVLQPPLKSGHYTTEHLMESNHLNS